MVYRAFTCLTRFKSPKSFVTNSYVVSCRIELAHFGPNPVYGIGGTSGSPDSALLHLPGAPRADQRIYRYISTYISMYINVYIDVYQRIYRCISTYISMYINVYIDVYQRIYRCISTYRSGMARPKIIDNRLIFTLNSYIFSKTPRIDYLKCIFVISIKFYVDIACQNIVSMLA
jgi:hypothetical protein